jgi:hypothetical protein
VVEAPVRPLPVSLTAAAAAVLCCLPAAARATTTAPAAPSVTISPLSGTREASPKTQISFLGAPANEITDVNVVGSQSGSHSGKLEAYGASPGASFVLARPLDQGEQVKVTAKVNGAPVSDNFTVADWVTYNFNKPTKPSSATSPSTVQSFVSAPTLHPPTVDVTTASPSAPPGDVFVAPNEGAGQWGPMIFSQQGQLVWFDPMSPGTFAMDFRVEPYEGTPDLVWWQGYIASIGVGFGIDEVYNAKYQKVAQIQAGNGYSADLHEVNITPQNTAWITAYTLVHANLGSAGGSSNGILLDPIIQEIDLKTGLVMFEWDPIGHVALSDSYTHPGPADYPWDWFHANSISLGPSNDILIDSRNTWTAYDVSLKTGKVLWRIGGKHPSFTMGPGTEVAYQHDAEWQPNGTISIFDDGASPPVHPQSRAIDVEINWPKRAVDLVSEVEHTPGLLTPSQGNDQILADGDSFVGWGQEPYFTAFSATGQMLFDAHFPAPGQSYRAYLFPWSGTPAAAPSVAAKRTSASAVSVYASWNGSTNVAAWRVLAGPKSSSLAQVGAAVRSNFETTIPVSTTQPVVAVQALSSTGQVLAQSAAVSVAA